MIDINYIKTALQDILNKEFKNPAKRNIIEYKDRFNCACPCCGDSNTDSHAKRGNLYFKNLFFICYNCEVKIPFTKLCSDFEHQLDPFKKMELLEQIKESNTSNTYNSSDKIFDTKLDKLIDFDALERLFNTYDTPITNFCEIKENTPQFEYLNKRGIDKKMLENIYSAKFWKNETFSEDVIVILNKRKNKILGIQLRNLKSGKARFFKIYNYEQLIKWLYGEDKLLEFTSDELNVYNKLSYFFNILNVNFSDKITIFEGYLDSIFYPNSVGVVGTNTDTKILEDNFSCQYFYDNDKTGFKKSTEKINAGFGVFLWKKLFKSVVDNKGSDDPYKLEKRISTIKDLNGLGELVKNPYKSLKLNEFFSKDVYDNIWIPKINSFIKRN